MLSMISFMFGMLLGMVSVPIGIEISDRTGRSTVLCVGLSILIACIISTGTSLLLITAFG